MHFNIDAATKISFFGDRYLHAYVLHKFSGQVASQLNLVARARQFSSFILLVGKIISADKFDPKAAIIIQNKDDLKIPLLLEQVPTTAEFNAAIESLSPEQQRFCHAYRSMQLSNTLFAVAVIQIKPQLEKLLKLPTDSLQKEIKLTQVQILYNNIFSCENSSTCHLILIMLIGFVGFIHHLSNSFRSHLLRWRSQRKQRLQD
jgi:hypothetical protein